MPRYPQAKVHIDLASPNGNVFAIVGIVKSALRKVGASETDIEVFAAEAMSSDYQHALDTCAEWVTFTTSN